MKLDLVDYKLLQIFYEKQDWNFQTYSLEDFSFLGLEIQATRYHLKKLIKAGYIKETLTYPRFYEPINNNEVRERLHKLSTTPLKVFLRNEGIRRKDG